MRKNTILGNLNELELWIYQNISPVLSINFWSSSLVALAFLLFLSLALQAQIVSNKATRSIDIEINEVTRPDVTVSPTGDFLVFTALGHLYRVPTTGGEAVQLTFGPYFDSDPSISPDGGQIAFASDRRGEYNGNIFILDLATNEIQQLTEEFWAARPVWSPDGLSIAYISYEHVGLWAEYEFVAENGVMTNVKQISANGGTVTRITDSPGLIRSVFFLSDGRIAWPRVVSGEGETLTHDLGTHTSMGNSRTIIEIGKKGAESLAVVAGVVDRVIATANGNGLIVRRYKIPASGYLIPQEEDIAYISLNGSDERSIIDLTNPQPTPGFGLTDNKVFIGHAGKLWSIDRVNGERKVVEFTAVAKMDILPRSKPITYNPDKDIRKQPTSILDPRLSPDGKDLVFTAAGYLWVQAMNGGEAKRLFPDGGFQWGAAVFSPDGKKLAYQHSEENVQHLRMVNLENGTWQDLHTTDRTGRFEPSWGTDSKQVIYVNFKSMLPSIWSIDIETKKQNNILGLPPRWMPQPQVCACPHASDSDEAKGKGSVPSVDDQYLYFTKLNQVYRRLLNEDKLAEPITDFKEGHLANGTVSPNGKWLAFRRNEEIWVAPLGQIPVTDEEAEKLTDDGGLNFSFAQDSRALIYATGNKVWKLAIEGGTPKEISVNINYPSQSKPSLLIKNVRVLDFTTSGFTEPTSILVEAGRIKTIGTQISSEHVKVLDAKGRYAIPGLWDSHVHTATPIHFNPARDVSNMSANIAYGVTSVRDMGSDITLVKAWTDRRTAFGDPVPRIFSAGAMVESVDNFFHGGSMFVHDDESARKVVVKEKTDGACGIKSYFTLTWPLHRSIADEAQKIEIPVYAHGLIFRETVMGPVLGRTSVEHQPSPIRLYSDVLKLMAATETKWCPTVAPIGGNGILFAQQPHLLSDPKLRAFTSQSDYALAQEVELFKGLDPELIGRSYKELMVSMNLGHKLGVSFLAGTDALNPNVFYGHGLHMELRHIAQSGIPLIDILRIATLDAAKTVGADNHLGSIETGKLADIVILDKNPLENIENTMDIWHVLLEGKIFSNGAETVEN